MTEQATKAPYKRSMRNFLLDAKFQLKFAAYFVVPTLLVTAMLGYFLWATTTSLFAQTSSAVDSRSKAAETSRELGTCSLNNELAKNMDDPDLASKLEERSKAINAAYEAEKQAVLKQQEDLVQQQKVTLWALIGGLLTFIVMVALIAIVLTHRIVGPLFRVKRMAREVTQGVIRPPSYGLRPGDELRDVFEVMATMITALRKRLEEDVAAVDKATAGDKAALEKLKTELQTRL
jgi:nitrogen fixation/metabolism regulation signal transduction histidine kinase